MPRYRIDCRWWVHKQEMAVSVILPTSIAIWQFQQIFDTRRVAQSSRYIILATSVFQLILLVGWHFNDSL